MCGGREGGHSQPVVGRRMQPLVGSVDFVQGFEGSYRGGLKEGMAFNTFAAGIAVVSRLRRVAWAI